MAKWDDYPITDSATDTDDVLINHNEEIKRLMLSSMFKVAFPNVTFTDETRISLIMEWDEGVYYAQNELDLFVYDENYPDNQRIIPIQGFFTLSFGCLILPDGTQFFDFDKDTWMFQGFEDSSLGAQKTMEHMEVDYHKITSWNRTPSDVYYPSEKLVKGAIDGLQKLIDIILSAGTFEENYIKSQMFEAERQNQWNTLYKCDGISLNKYMGNGGYGQVASFDENGASMVNGHTVESDVPVNAEFTDTISDWNATSGKAFIKNKPTHLSGDISTDEKGVANGVATLDSDGKVPASQLPSYVDDVLEYANKASFPSTGESGKIYIDNSTNIQYRWSGTQYVEISSSLALGETASTAYAGDKGKANAEAISTLQAKVNTLPTKFAPADAQKNVQSDWNATSGDAFIKNKPDIPTDTRDLTNGAEFVDKSYVQNYITPEVIASVLGYTPISNRDTVTESKDGLMTSDDYKKLVGIENNATHVDKQTVEQWGFGTYSLPEDGIKEYDLHYAIQTILDNAILGIEIGNEPCEPSGRVVSLPECIAITEKGANNGVATLDSDGKVPTSQLPETQVVTEDTVSGWGFTKNTGTYSKPSGGIPKTDLASAVQTSLGKADSALQSYTEKYTGTITGIKMNGASKGTSGVVDLGTVLTSHQDISGKENSSNKVTSWSNTTTDTHYPSEKLVKSSLDGKANSSHTHTKSQITDFPTSMPASDVQAYAKTGSGITVEKSVPSDAKFTDTTYDVATTSANGLMSSTDKTNLENLNDTSAWKTLTTFNGVPIKYTKRANTLFIKAYGTLNANVDVNGKYVTIGTLPAGYRPIESVLHYIPLLNNRMCQFIVGTGGAVQIGYCAFNGTGYILNSGTGLYLYETIAL